MTDRPPWEEDDDDDVAAAGAALLAAAGVDVAFARKLEALPADEGAVYDALTARANESPADLRAWQAAKEEIRRTGRLGRRAPKPHEVRIPKEIVEAMDYLTVLGVPPKDVERVARDELDDTPAIIAVKGMRDAGRKMLVLAGERGCGKSLAAAAWLYNYEPAKSSMRTAMRTTGRRFLEADRVHKLDETRLSEAAYAVALVLDDVGVGGSDFDDRTMATLLTRRYRHGLDTVITTNLSVEEFVQRYGDRVFDRVCEVGAWLSVGTESLRSKS